MYSVLVASKYGTLLLTQVGAVSHACHRLAASKSTSVPTGELVTLHTSIRYDKSLYVVQDRSARSAAAMPIVDGKLCRHDLVSCLPSLSLDNTCLAAKCVEAKRKAGVEGR